MLLASCVCDVAGLWTRRWSVIRRCVPWLHVDPAPEPRVFLENEARLEQQHPVL